MDWDFQTNILFIAMFEQNQYRSHIIELLIKHVGPIYSTQEL